MSKRILQDLRAPDLRRFDLSELPEPNDGLLWAYKQGAYWWIDIDADIAQQEATGYPVGELVEYEQMGDWEAGETGELLIIDVGGAVDE